MKTKTGNIKMSVKAKYLLILIFFISLGMLFAHGERPPQKKIIFYSWDLLWARTDDLINNLDALEKLPADGIAISIYLKRGKSSSISFRTVMDGPKWQKEWFNRELEKLKKISQGKLKNNFISTRLSLRHRISWDDDKAWENCAYNFGIMAWLSKQSGAKGLILDPEDYHKSKQFKFLSEDGNYDTTAKLARKRGAQIIEAIGKEYPDAVLLFFWLFSLEPDIYHVSGSPLENAEIHNSLWPHFINGMLDKLPHSMIVVDATENAYHYYADKMDFYNAAWDITRRGVFLADKINREKYRNQVQVGFGLYLDMYTNSPKATWYAPPLNNSRLERFCDNFKQALSACDEYCWLYGERKRLINWNWKQKREKAPTWDEALPGLYSEIAIIKNPGKHIELIKKQIKSKQLKNLVKNPECKLCNSKDKNKSSSVQSDWTQGGLPDNWHFWQKKYNGKDTKEGKFGIDSAKGYKDNYSVYCQGVSKGCFIVKVPVKPGRLYAVEAYCTGSKKSRIGVRWQYKNKWIRQNLDQTILFPDDNESDWRRALGIIDVPPGVDTMVLLLSVSLNKKEITWFDNPGVYEL